MKYTLYILFLFFSENLFACQCVFHEISQHYDRADFVFLGEVVDKQELCSLGMEKENRIICIGGPSVSLVQPDEIFKSPSSLFEAKTGKSFRRVYLIEDSGNCGVDLEVGEKYLIFSNSVTFSMYTTSRCHGTTLAGATRIVNELRELVNESNSTEKP